MPIDWRIVCSQHFEIAMWWLLLYTRHNAPSFTANAKIKLVLSGPLEILCTWLAFWMALLPPLCMLGCYTVFLSLPMTETIVSSFEGAFLTCRMTLIRAITNHVVACLACYKAVLDLSPPGQADMANLSTVPPSRQRMHGHRTRNDRFVGKVFSARENTDLRTVPRVASDTSLSCFLVIFF